ncbi:AraC family transcriptional regulator [Streptomyces agglomeratus]|uniref:GlxA family transcriptional regulator n=1 Tax=Streptomyces agglomeratus TaxID=285458 RepID=UPI00085486B7|nr:GlxA family transcriptional regulator [Streptomyces agglomeratus]OEJ41917.1 AraC family transcriptional regulator [Streptomyces agglomeratus]OEJ43705.1 AraC family transcriptional regulator [Streptomyces agglomeratus]
MTQRSERSVRTSRSVVVVLFDDVQSLDVTGPVEVFAGAALEAAGGHGAADAAYRIRTASLDGAPVRTSSGLTLVPDGALDAEPAPHILLVPGGRGTRTPDPRMIDWLRENAPRAERLVSVCTGALLLAAAGLLDGRRATTHWGVSEHLARTYPAVEVDPDPIYVRDGNVATSAGVTAGIDLALALVEEDLGRDIALTVARHLVVFLRRPGNQAQFSAQLAAQTALREPLREVQQWITEHPGDDLSVESLAGRARLSPRQFARAFRSETGTTPGKYVERVRLEHARRLLEDCADGIEEISRACGYGTPEAMRRAFVKSLGTAPAEYRRRFRPQTTPR